MALVLTMRRVAENRYLAYLSGGVARRQYELQFKLQGVNMDWEYAGVFLSDSAGKITTFELTLPNPNSEYPYIFRWRDTETGATSNTVTIDPLNPPPINGGENGGGNGGDGGAEAGFNVVSLIVVAVLVFVLLAAFGGGKR
jgi:hypothetical protein